MIIRCQLVPSGRKRSGWNARRAGDTLDDSVCVTRSVRGATRAMSAELPRRLVAEAVGTALLVLFGPGSVVAALKLGKGVLDFPGLGMVALAFGLVIAIVIYAFGTTSGAHINPAVTVSLAATGRFPWPEVPGYILAQLVGAFGGGLL